MWTEKELKFLEENKDWINSKLEEEDIDSVGFMAKRKVNSKFETKIRFYCCYLLCGPERFTIEINGIFKTEVDIKLYQPYPDETRYNLVRRYISGVGVNEISRSKAISLLRPQLETIIDSKNNPIIEDVLEKAKLEIVK